MGSYLSQGSKEITANSGEDIHQQFVQHCDDNNLEGVIDCLSRGADVNTVLEDGNVEWTGLTIAAHENYPELVDILLSHPDIEINKTKYISPHGAESTALMEACRAGNSAIVSRLAQVPGLDFNWQEKFGHTAAHLAIYKAHTECVRILAETGRVDWNYRRNREGWNPLFLSLAQSSSDRLVDIVDIIVRQPNINYGITTRRGQTLAHAVVMREDVNVKYIEILAAQEKFDYWNVADYYGNIPIMIVLKRGDQNTLVILTNIPRVDLNVIDNDGQHVEDVAR